MRVAAPVVASVLCLLAPWACALSLGPVSSAGRLGQPLDFAVAVKLDADESLAAQCVAAEVTAGDHRIPAAQVRTRLQRAGRERIARVSTTTRLSEPVVTVLLTLGCPPKLSHKFVSLLDPPLPTAGAPRSTATSGAASERDESAAPAASPGVDAMPPAVIPDAAERARQREQLLALEERLARQGLELRSTQESLAAMQARLRESEEARRSNPAKYGLVALVLMLSITVAVLLWRLARLERKHRWATDTKTLTEDVALRETAKAPRSATVHPPFAEATVTSMRVLSDSLEQAGDDSADRVREVAGQTDPTAARVRQQLTADELIDLEQQADFFIVLGQEEAAIDLLMSHVRSSGGTSPMPYLKLLEIYRRRGDSDAYDRIRERFNRRFNAHAPAWEVDPKAGRALESYPDTLTRVQGTWPVAPRVVDLLGALLFRRDASDGVFDLPAFEELLFLYTVARDVVEHESTPDGVDLLLPLGADEPASAIVHADVTRPPDRWLEGVPPTGVDVELDLDSPSGPPADSQPR